MTGTPLSVVAGVTRAKLRAVTCTTSCAHRSPSPQLALLEPLRRPLSSSSGSSTSAVSGGGDCGGDGGGARRRTATTAEVSVGVFRARADDSGGGD